MSKVEATTETKVKVGIFTLLGIFLVGAITVFVNDKPFWWRPCQLVHIQIADATGLKTKSPVRSLGLQIGYLSSVELHETYVYLGICVTAPVEVLPATRAYIRGEGFLGDKFVELKPVKYTGERYQQLPDREEPDQEADPDSDSSSEGSSIAPDTPHRIWTGLIIRALSQTALAQRGRGREVPVGDSPSQGMDEVIKKVDGMVGEIESLTNNLQKAIDPAELRATIQQLNKTLEAAGTTLSPKGALTTTAQRALAKLEDAIEQLRDVLTQINQGQGSVGRLIKDPSFADGIEEMIRNVNRVLSKASGFRFVVDIGSEQIDVYDGQRSWVLSELWVTDDRYYLLGLSTDPRGKLSATQTTTSAGGGSTTVETSQVEQGGIEVTAMLGKVLWRRLDLAAGLIHGDGALSMKLLLGWGDFVRRIRLEGYAYTRTVGFRNNVFHMRANAIVFPLSIKPFHSLYLKGGLDSIKTVGGERAWMIGAGLSFEDDDIKFLFSLI